MPKKGNSTIGGWKWVIHRRSAIYYQDVLHEFITSKMCVPVLNILWNLVREGPSGRRRLRNVHFFRKQAFIWEQYMKSEFCIVIHWGINMPVPFAPLGYEIQDFENNDIVKCRLHEIKGLKVWIQCFYLKGQNTLVRESTLWAGLRWTST